ncbi:hypothetical protein KEJ27_09250 [Candidatus Bathyarchaeota archaeon]|nr:hypothetical protein [Candidatus Bathyarchaeota archaeon]
MVDKSLSRSLELIDNYYKEFIQKYIEEFMGKLKPRELCKQDDIARSIEDAYNDTMKALEGVLSELYKDDKVAEHIIIRRIRNFIREKLETYAELFKKTHRGSIF